MDQVFTTIRKISERVLSPLKVQKSIQSDKQLLGLSCNINGRGSL